MTGPVILPVAHGARAARPYLQPATRHPPPETLCLHRYSILHTRYSDIHSRSRISATGPQVKVSGVRRSFSSTDQRLSYNS